MSKEISQAGHTARARAFATRNQRKEDFDWLKKGLPVKWKGPSVPPTLSRKAKRPDEIEQLRIAGDTFH
jgi:hypothetical protein